VAISFAKIRHDFADIEDNELFIVEIDTIAEIKAALNALAAMDEHQLRTRFTRFKQKCVEKFSWHNTAATISSAIEHAIAVRKDRGDPV
jgi:hypothetical protein